MFVGVLLCGLVSLRERLGWVLPLVLALQGVLGGLQLLDAAGVVYFPTIHRATVTRVFSLGFDLVLPLVVLLVLWVLLGWLGGLGLWVFAPVVGGVVFPLWGLGGALGLGALVACVVGVWRGRCRGGMVFWVLVMASGFELLALVHWLVLLPLGVAGPLVGVADLELSLFFVSGYLAPLLVLPLLFWWVVRWVVEWGFDIRLGGVLGEVREDLRRRETIFILAALVLLGVFSAFYPYLGGVNPRGLNVGVDAPRYVDSLLIVEGGVWASFSEMGGSRPLIFLTLYGFERVTGLSAELAVRYLPVFLVPLLVLSAFFLGWVVTGGRRMALWSAFLMLCGVQVVVGMYAYFLTNMLALPIVLFSIGLLLMSLRGGDNVTFVLAVSLGGLLPFVHPWTFDQFLGSVGLLAVLVGYEVWRNGDSRDTFLRLFLYCGFLLGFDQLKGLVFHGVGGVQATSTVISGLAGLGEFWSSSIFNFRLLFGGGTSNIVLISLSLVGLWLLSGRKHENRLWMVLLAATSLVFLVGNDTVKSRLLYNVPFFLLASLGVEFILLKVRERRLYGIFIVFLVFFSLTYLFRSLANLS